MMSQEEKEHQMHARQLMARFGPGTAPRKTPSLFAQPRVAQRSRVAASLRFPPPFSAHERFSGSPRAHLRAFSISSSPSAERRGRRRAPQDARGRAPLGHDHAPRHRGRSDHPLLHARVRLGVLPTGGEGVRSGADTSVAATPHTGGIIRDESERLSAMGNRLRLGTSRAHPTAARLLSFRLTSFPTRTRPLAAVANPLNRHRRAACRCFSG